MRILLTFILAGELMAREHRGSLGNAMAVARAMQVPFMIGEGRWSVRHAESVKSTAVWRRDFGAVVDEAAHPVVQRLEKRYDFV